MTRHFYRRAAGTSLLLSGREDGTPSILHWGADLGELSGDDLDEIARSRTPRVPHSALDEPRRVGLIPETASGFTGTPAVEGTRVGGSARAWAPRFAEWTVSTSETSAQLRSTDDESGLSVLCELELTREGLVRMRATLRNDADGEFHVAAVRVVLPVGAQAVELLDLTGRWSRERAPQRRAWAHGTWQRAGRHGRTGHDATLLLVAGTPAFDHRNGTVWGVHVAWSGDHTTYAERTADGESLLAGHELLGPGEVVLSPGETYTSPWLVGSWSDRGLDGLSERLHGWTRRHSPRTRTPRPVVANTWEAAYFDHDLTRLTALADATAEVGAERFVLDDGWFRGRRHDAVGLGDWAVDREVWPDGLHPLVDHVHGLGMDFGLWVEPEMVNLDSDLARAHPDWVLTGRSSMPPEWRHQQVLDLQHEAAYTHVRDSLLALLDEYPIGFLKWDHNRDLVDVAHDGRPAVHGQTLALYRLLDELREAHPGLEIESCASGGGRVDLGILTRTDRVWPSDTIDALERQQIQRWTSLLVPPELVGTHVGSPVAHTTGRRHRLGFRAATALLGHLGIEWDITALGPEERSELAAWVALHKQVVRPLLTTGTLVHPVHPDPTLLVTGMVAEDRTDAVFVVAAVASSATTTPVPVRLEGLDADARYSVEEVGPGDRAPRVDLGRPWLSDGPLVLPGSALAGSGLAIPVLAPESARVLRCRSV